MEKRKPSIVFGLTIIFTFLFYNKPIGLNLLIFESLLITAVIFLLPKQKVSLNQKLLIGFFLIGGISVVANYTLLAILFNVVSGIVLMAFLAQPAFRSIAFAFPAGIKSMPASVRLFFKNILVNTPFKSKPSLIYVSILPLIIVIFYIILYSASNPFFNDAVQKAGLFIGKIFYWDINYMQILILFLVGTILISPFFYFKANNYWSEKDATSEEELNRRKYIINYSFRKLGLLNEYRSGIVLFTLLNIILFYVNILDIKNIWFNFEWSGQYLKQFVHEGTYMLIFSIILGIVLILVYFRGNLNFYSRNYTLKWLAYAWLAQNAILAFSVAIRNFWYINYFALAYKRIGVIFFLLFIIILIVTVIIKIKEKRSNYYLMKVNSWSLFLIIFFMSLFNWDNIIAKYNLSNYDKSFVHWDFLAYLPDKTLSVLSISDEKIKDIEQKQERLFNFEERYISGERYSEIIERRRETFIDKWENKSVLSWNLPEYVAYKELTKEK